MSLVSWYKLDGDADDSWGSNNGTTSNVTYVAGKIGQCGSFNGTSSYVLIANPFTTGQEFSIAFWGYLGATKTHCFTSCRTVVGYGVSIFAIGNTLRFDTGGLSQWTTSYNMPTLTWVHIALTKTEDILKLYINGTFHSSSATVGNMTTLGSMYSIGASQIDGASWDNYLRGYVDDYRIYNHALSPKEVKDLAQAKILHYKFDDFQEPTTNLVSYPDYSNRAYDTKFYIGGWGGDGADVYYYADGGFNDLAYMKMVKRTGGTGGSYVDNNYPVPIVAGTTYTVSGYMKASRPFVANSYSLCLNRTVDNVYITGLSSCSLTTEWQRFSYTFTATSDNAGDLVVRTIIYVDDDLPIDIYWSGIQVEAKDHVTDYVNDSRTGTILDSSSYNNHATLTEANTPQWTEECKVGFGSYLFKNKYFQTDNILDIKNGVTLSVWINCNDLLGTYRNLIVKGNAGQQWIWLTLVNNNIVGKVIIGGIAYSVNVACSPVIGTWMHFAMTHDTNEIRVYKNGVLLGNPTAAVGQIDSSNVKFMIGNSQEYWGETLAWNINAYIDDVRIYATALSAADILNLYQTRAYVDSHGKLEVYELDQRPANVTTAVSNKGVLRLLEISEVGITDGLVGWWPLDGNAYDISGYAHDGTVTGATVTQGKNQLAYSFNGTSNYISGPALSLDGTSCSLSLWAYITGFENQVMFSSYTGPGCGFYNSGVTLKAMNAGSSVRMAYTTGLSTGQWNHIIITYDASGIPTAYFNGTAATYNGSNNYWQHTITDFTIGCRYSGGYSAWYSGKIQDVRIYNRALSSYEVSMLYKMTSGISAMEIANNGYVYTHKIKEVQYG